MPQLMPLNWMFSIFMMIMILMVANIIYSESMKTSGIMVNFLKDNSKMSMWW